MLWIDYRGQIDAISSAVGCEKNQAYDLFDEERLGKHVSIFYGRIEMNHDDDSITNCLIEEIDITNKVLCAFVVSKGSVSRCYHRRIIYT